MDKSDFCIYGYLLILAVCSVIYGIYVVVESDNSAVVSINVVLPPDAVYNTNSSYVSDIGSISKVVKNFTVTVWWGLVENEAGSYDWSAYQSLFNTINNTVNTSQIRVDFAFHSCNNTADCGAVVSLPNWVTALGPTIFYTDANNYTAMEYISPGLDHVPIFPPANSRTAVQIYTSLIFSFLKTFNNLLDSSIYEISVGLGAKGRFSYPAFPDSYWKVPGIGQFQSYDPYLKAEYLTYATKSGNPDFAYLPYPNWLSYNNLPSEASFFDIKFQNDSTSSYGAFFHSMVRQQIVASRRISFESSFYYVTNFLS